eukprot:7773402-Ditylum_brightwellii.AAC.1
MDTVQYDDNEDNITDKILLRNCWQASPCSVYSCHDISACLTSTTQSSTVSALAGSNSPQKPIYKHDEYWEQQAKHLDEWKADAKDKEKEQA